MRLRAHFHVPDIPAEAKQSPLTYWQNFCQYLQAPCWPSTCMWSRWGKSCKSTFVLFSNMQVGMWPSSHLFKIDVAWLSCYIDWALLSKMITNPKNLKLVGQGLNNMNMATWKIRCKIWQHVVHAAIHLLLPNWKSTSKLWNREAIKSPYQNSSFLLQSCPSLILVLHENKCTLPCGGDPFFCHLVVFSNFDNTWKCALGACSSLKSMNDNLDRKWGSTMAIDTMVYGQRRLLMAL